MLRECGWAIWPVQRIAGIERRPPDPQDLATEAITELEAIVDDLREIVALIEQEEGVEL